MCGKLECRDGNLAWYFWPNADYFEECHVPAPLSHGHKQHGADIPVHGDFHHPHAVGLPVVNTGHFNHQNTDNQLHLTQPHHAAVPVNVHIDHVHHPEEHHVAPVVPAVAPVAPAVAPVAPAVAPVAAHPVDLHHGGVHHGGYDVWPGHDTHATPHGVAGAWGTGHDANGAWGAGHGHAALGYGF